MVHHYMHDKNQRQRKMMRGFYQSKESLKTLVCGFCIIPFLMILLHGLHDQ